MAQHITKGEEFEKKAEKKINGWGLFGSKYEDAAELYAKSANQFKLAKSCIFFSSLSNLHFFFLLFLLIAFSKFLITLIRIVLDTEFLSDFSVNLLVDFIYFVLFDVLEYLLKLFVLHRIQGIELHQFSSNCLTAIWRWILRYYMPKHNFHPSVFASLIISFFFSFFLNYYWFLMMKLLCAGR